MTHVDVHRIGTLMDPSPSLQCQLRRVSTVRSDIIADGFVRKRVRRPDVGTRAPLEHSHTNLQNHLDDV